MNELLTKVLDAHGGLDRWRSYNKVEATIVSGGGFFALKGVLQDANPRRMTVWLHEERSSVTPYGAADQRTMFTPDRIAIEKLDGTVVAEQKMDQTIPMLMQWCESFDVGADTGSPVIDGVYQVPFRFTGKLDKLTLTIDRPKLSPEDIEKLKAAMHNNPAAD